MRSTRSTLALTSWALISVALISVLSTGVAWAAEPPSIAKHELTTSDRSEGEKQVSVEIAQQRARLAHNILSAMLDVMHHRYFRNDRSTVPARAMEDAFPWIADQENIRARWIAVNAKVMNVDHEPQDDFEKQAARRIAAGNSEHELVQNGIYRRAAGISLMNKGCLDCHLGFGASGKTDRFAGLVITIELTE